MSSMEDEADLRKLLGHSKWRERQLMMCIDAMLTELKAIGVEQRKDSDGPGSHFVNVAAEQRAADPTPHPCPPAELVVGDLPLGHDFTGGLEAIENDFCTYTDAAGAVCEMYVEAHIPTGAEDSQQNTEAALGACCGVVKKLAHRLAVVCGERDLLRTAANKQFTHKDACDLIDLVRVLVKWHPKLDYEPRRPLPGGCWEEARCWHEAAVGAVANFVTYEWRGKTNE